MTRALKVYGGRGHKVGGMVCRMIVATTTKREAIALLGVTAHEFKDYYCETGNQREIEIAMKTPGYVYFQSGFGGYLPIPTAIADSFAARARTPLKRSKPEPRYEDQEHECSQEMVCYCGICNESFDYHKVFNALVRSQNRNAKLKLQVVDLEARIEALKDRLEALKDRLT